MAAKYNLAKVFPIIAVLAMIFSSIQPPAAQAQGGDGLQRQVNAESGRVSFISPASGRSLSAARALGQQAIRSQDPAMALANRYAPEFGLRDAERSLTAMESNRTEAGHITARFQQNYQDVPVMGGELIVNTNDGGDLYSISGEVSPDLSISTQPAIDAAQARETALGAMAKWYGKTPEDFVSTEPELWIYDESLLQPSTRPVELTWRVEVAAKDQGMPVRELVLVNAQRGNVSLHFNQVDMAQADLLGNTWYVAPSGNDTNTCSAPAIPCASINAAIVQANAGDTIKVAVGTYTGMGTEVVLITKNITLSGGWDAGFTSQTGWSTIDGQGARRGILNSISITTLIERFIIQNGNVDTYGGGGISNGLGTMTLNDSIVRNNFGLNGGGINNQGTMTVNNTSVSDNTGGYAYWSGGGGGGGINNSGGTLSLNNSTVSGNTLLGNFDGSGIYVNGTVYLNNTTVTGNTGEGAIYIPFGTIFLNNSTISYNQSYGFYNVGGHVTLQNTMIAKNGNVSDCDNNIPYSGTVVSQGYNLIGNGGGCSITPTIGDMVGTTANPINPRLALLKDNGGPTLTHALMIGSPAIDAGNPVTCLSTDQRGVARPVGAKCDIGAYEGSVPFVASPLVSTYDARQGSNFPGAFICNEVDPKCGLGNVQAKAAHQYAIGTFYFYYDKYSRNSIDNAGMTIISSVDACSWSPVYGNTLCPYANTYWDGNQVVYGNAYGYPQADDIVAHEITHGVTQYESNLFYYYQSGAINESFSDLWGEYYDQSNGLGNDTPGARWIIGEDISGYPVPAGFSVPAIRSMSNPPALQDPDRMSSPYYYEGENDNGGVHWNSGINNKAVYLMVDGGPFNGRTVKALGWDKVGAIYYAVNTNLLTSGADYSDLYYALQQACANLIGQKGIIAADCLAVKEAIDAVEMNAQPATNFNADAPLCTVSAPVINLADDLEAGSGKWTFSKTGTAGGWQLDSPYGQYAQSGQHFLYGDDYPQTGGIQTEAQAKLASFLVPQNSYLWFAQAYDFESGYDTNDPILYNYDGGVLEYSLTGGSTWVDAGSLIDYNGYKGSIYNKPDNGVYINPLHGKSAFVGASHGYISTRLNLGTLAGKTVSFRWRMGLDGSVSAWGWWVDNIKVYTCGKSATFADVPQTHPYFNDIEILYADGLTGGCNLSPLKFCPDQIMDRAQAAVFMVRGAYGAGYVPNPSANLFQDNWTPGLWARPWAEAMRETTLTTGCSLTPWLYCPWTKLPREQVVIFGLKMKYGNGYQPPAATGTVFADLTDPNYYATAWAEQAYADGLITNCGVSGGKPKFCPSVLVTRGLGAYVIVRAKNLSMP